jgi:two-component system alkaline phosphatase synthesis response regulator PhoP
MLAKTKILLVDDEPDVLTFLAYNLRNKNFEVAVAVNGVDGIEKVNVFNPDIILSDVMMPEMDGIHMCETLKAQQKYKNIPVIFLSALQDDYQSMRAIMSGDDFISKPASLSLIFKIIEQHCSLLRV